MYKTREAFINALDKYLFSTVGLGYRDLPDTVDIDDWFYEGCGESDLRDCAWDILDNAGYPRGLIDEVIYNIREEE